MTHTLVIFGYGSQGRAQALNLKDGGFNPTIFLYDRSPSIARAKGDGFSVLTHPTDISSPKIAIILTPDETQATLYNKILEPNLPKNAALIFAHGYAIHYHHITPRTDLDILLAAPTCPGGIVRKRFEEKKPIPIATAIHQNGSGNAESVLRNYIAAVTGDRCDLIESSFKEETETNLFVEQALLCGGYAHFVVAVFDTMVNAGYNPKIAYYWCLHDMQYLTELYADKGLTDGFMGISRTARYGALTRGHRVIDDHVKKNLRRVLTDVQDGTFDRELTSATKDPDIPWRDHLIEKIHRQFKK